MSEYICPHCQNAIYDDDALLCHFCGESLQRPVGSLGKLKYARPRLPLWIMIGVTILAFGLLMVLLGV